MTILSPINRAVLDELRAHVGESIVAKVVEQFALDVERRLAKMPTLPPDQLAREAHGLKGSALEVGATAVIQAAQRLERDAVSMSAAELENSIQTLAQLVAQARQALANGLSESS